MVIEQLSIVAVSLLWFIFPYCYYGLHSNVVIKVYIPKLLLWFIFPYCYYGLYSHIVIMVYIPMWLLWFTFQRGY